MRSTSKLIRKHSTKQLVMPPWNGQDLPHASTKWHPHLKKKKKKWSPSGSFQTPGRSTYNGNKDWYTLKKNIKRDEVEKEKKKNNKKRKGCPASPTAPSSHGWAFAMTHRSGQTNKYAHHIITHSNHVWKKTSGSLGHAERSWVSNVCERLASNTHTCVHADARRMPVWWWDCLWSVCHSRRAMGNIFKMEIKFGMWAMDTKNTHVPHADLISMNKSGTSFGKICSSFFQQYSKKRNLERMR